MMCYPKSNEVKRAVNEALRRFYLNDRYLIDHDVNERSLTFRLGFYLQHIFSGWDVDCEFNRNVASGNGRKQLPDPDSPTRPKVRPAITSRSIPWMASNHWFSCLKATLRFLIVSRGSDITEDLLQK